jgi:hypothetical protein
MVRGRQLEASELFSLLRLRVGAAEAQGYVAVRELREFLPTAEDVLTDPTKAKVPEDVGHQIGALGLLSEVCKVDAYAAWAYAERLVPEYQQAAAQVLRSKVGKKDGKSKHRKAGAKARQAILGAVGRRGAQS